jgi:sugar phosphate isomerase/epimerase
MKIGVRLESLGLPLRRALESAAQLGVGGVQVDAVGDLAPDALSQTGRRAFRNLLRSHNLELTALGCPMRRGLDVAENLEARIEHVRKVMALSVDLGPRRVIVEAGRIPEDEKGAAFTLLSESLLALGHHGDRVGAVLALETGQESGETLARFLARFDTGGLGVNLDPANLLIHGFDPYAAVPALGKRIVHIHAKDARSASASRSAAEVPLGHGDLDWLRLLGLFEEVEYHGWLTVERESGARKLPDVTEGVGFLRRLVR